VNNVQRLSLPKTVPAGVEVWLLRLDLQAPMSSADFLLLSESERACALRFHTHADQVRSTATRAALRRILATKVALPPHALHFVMNHYGKPHLHGDTGIDFNVSHAGQFALIAISTHGQVGVDIEDCNRQLDISALADYVFTDLERQSELVTTTDFIKRWVAKESVLKAVGVGISEHLQTVSVLPGKNGSYQIICDYPEWPGLKVWSIEVLDCYAAALALRSAPSLIEEAR